MPIENLTVPVDIPHTQIVHTARLQRIVTSSGSPQRDFVPLGEGIRMELSISHTRRWDGPQSKEAEGQALEFYYEMRANSDAWVVGGQRKAHFTSVVSMVAGNEITFILMSCTGKGNQNVCVAAMAPNDRTPDAAFIGDLSI